MNTCVFPGSFDPVTRGHLDLISRAASLFDRVTVAVMNNPNKRASLLPDDRVSLIQKCCSDYDNVIVERWDGLLADFMLSRKETVILRGVRSSLEFENEKLSYFANKLLNNRIETFFLCANPSLGGISSSAVKEIFSFGGDISAFVPERVSEEIKLLLSNKK